MVTDIGRDDKRAIIYCVDDDKFRIYPDVCNNLNIEMYFNNYLRTRTHINNIPKRQRVNFTSYLFLIKYMYVKNVTDHYNSFSNCTCNENEGINNKTKYLFHLVYF